MGVERRAICVLIMLRSSVHSCSPSYFLCTFDAMGGELDMVWLLLLVNVKHTHAEKIRLAFRWFGLSWGFETDER